MLPSGCIANLMYFFPMKKAKIADKTIENRDKRTKLYFATYSLSIFAVAVTAISYMMSRRYTKSINYLPKLDAFEFNFYGLFC